MEKEKSPASPKPKATAKKAEKAKGRRRGARKSKPVLGEYSGMVVSKLVSKGSKSERQAMQLDTDRGLLTLRRPGRSAFDDQGLADLVGKEIKCVGLRKGRYLYVKDWAFQAPDDDGDSTAEE